jgi:hypothetical protein
MGNLVDNEHYTLPHHVTKHFINFIRGNCLTQTTTEIVNNQLLYTLGKSAKRIQQWHAK